MHSYKNNKKQELIALTEESHDTKYNAYFFYITIVTKSFKIIEKLYFSINQSVYMDCKREIKDIIEKECKEKTKIDCTYCSLDDLKKTDIKSYNFIMSEIKKNNPKSNI